MRKDATIEEVLSWTYRDELAKRDFVGGLGKHLPCAQQQYQADKRTQDRSNVHGSSGWQSPSAILGSLPLLAMRERECINAGS